LNRESRLLLLSAPDRATLTARMQDLLTRPDGGESLLRPEISGRDPERLAIVYPPGGLRERLEAAVQRLPGWHKDRWWVRDLGLHFGSGIDPGRIAFLFPGEGSQRVGMLREARERLAPVRTWLESLDSVYLACGEPPPSHIIYPPAADGVPQEAALFDVAMGGQVGTVLNLALYEVLGAWGIRPDVVLGHSNGEHAAVMVACMDPAGQKDIICRWLRKVSIAGQSLGSPPIPQTMLALSTMRPECLDPVLAQFPRTLFLAMDNCPLQQVLGGTREAVDSTIPLLTDAGGICVHLPFTRAYHTPLFAPWARMLEQHYPSLPLERPRIPWVSCLDGAEMGPSPAGIRKAMVGQWTRLVRFRQALETLYQAGVRTFVEVGPSAKLSAFVADTLRGRPHVALSSNAAQRGDMAQLHLLLAALHVQGVNLDTPHLNTAAPSPSPRRPSQSWAALLEAQQALIRDAKEGMERMAERFRFTGDTSVTPLPPPGAGLLGPCSASGGGDLAMQRLLTLERDPYLRDHSLGRPPGPALAVLSFTTSLALAVEAARCLAASGQEVLLEDLEASRWLALDGGRLNLGIRGQRRGSAIDLILQADTQAPAFRARLTFGRQPPAPFPLFAGGHPAERWTPERFYREYAFHGTCFQGLQRVTEISPQGIAAQLMVTTLPGVAPGSLAANPALLDCAGQLVAFWLLEQVGLPPKSGIFPYAAERLVLRAPPPPGTLVDCRGSITFQEGLGTEANFVFSVQGREIAYLQGFSQRLLELPEALADRIFGGPHPQLSAAATRGGRNLDLSAWRDVLEAQDRIWGRALAHLLLCREELDAWLAEPGTDRLLEWVLIKETALTSARDRAWPVQWESELRVDGGRVQGPGGTLCVQLSREGEILYALVDEGCHG
jgi:malonyl CoA-acyl carrier protein transacylase